MPDDTKGKAEVPKIGQRFAFSVSEVKERGGLNGLLFAILMNRPGTRLGRFTLFSFGLWVLVFVVVGWILPPPPREDSTTALIFALWFLGYLLLLLNRFDSSGPTKEEFERARESWLRNRPKHILGRKARTAKSSGKPQAIERDPKLEHIKAESKSLEAQIDEISDALHPKLTRANQIVDRIQAIAENGGYQRPVLLSKVGASSAEDALAALYLVTAETFKTASLNNTLQNQALLQKYLQAAGGIALWSVTMFTTDGREFSGEIDKNLRDSETIDSFVEFLKTTDPSASDYWKKIYLRVGI